MSFAAALAEDECGRVGIARAADAERRGSESERRACFRLTMDVKYHQPSGHAQHQVAIGGWEIAYARIQGGLK